MSISVLYHGTLTENSRQILAEGLLKVTDKQNTPYALAGFLSTTPGYVYLSSNLNEALGFAVQNALTKGARPNVTVFEVHLCQTELETDLDELQIRATVTQIDIPQPSCFRVKRSLHVGAEVVRYVDFSFRNAYDGWAYADDPSLVDKIRTLWRPLKPTTPTHH